MLEESASLAGGEVVKKVPRRDDDAAGAAGYGGRPSSRSHRSSQLDPVSGGPAQSDTAYARCAWKNGSVCLQVTKPVTDGSKTRFGCWGEASQAEEKYVVDWRQKRPRPDSGLGSGQGEGTQRRALVIVCVCVMYVDGGVG